MTVFLNPRAEADFRARHGFVADDPGPDTLESHVFPPDEARGRDFCPPVPKGGPGKVRLDEILRDAWRVGQMHNPNIGLEGAAAGAILAKNSKTGGKWDIKNVRDARGRKLYPDGQEYGDFLYGATSTGMGFGPTISDLGADLYSVWTNRTLEDKDAWIRAGQRYAKLRCDDR